MEGGHSLLERLLHDKNAEPTDMPISLLKSITDNFADALKIGCGGFAVVYKGLLKNGSIVAVKKLSNSICMDENKYNQEVSCLMRVKHRNVVRFLGYCADTQGKMSDYGGKFVMADVRERLLCFEYVPNGTLKDYITDASNGLEWRKCYQIIKGISEGLHYLHGLRIVHLDLKPANILLDDNMVPKIADFGISRCFDQEQSWAIATKLVGTPGYLAPESYTRKITTKLDMYSLGVIIIEILTGQKGYSSVENVLESWRNRLKTSSAIDTVLEQIRVCFEISIDCMDFNPEKRPTTRRIIELLEQTERMDQFNETEVQVWYVSLINSP